MSILTLTLLVGGLGADPVAPPNLPPVILPAIRVNPALTPGQSSRTPTEPGIYADFFGFDTAAAALWAIPRLAAGLAGPRTTGPEVIVIIREGVNLTRRGNEHWWEHLAEMGYPNRLKEPFKATLRNDVIRKYEAGTLKPVETFRFRGHEIEYRPFEIAPGRVNVGRATTETYYTSPFVRYGWTGGAVAPALVIPSSAPVFRTPSLLNPPTPWADRLKLSGENGVSKYGLGVDLNLTSPSQTVKTPLDLKAGARTTPVWHPPMISPKGFPPPK